MLSLQFTRAGHARRCAALAGLMPTTEARYAFTDFMHTLLARRLAVGRLPDATAERHAVEDLWRDALINKRWQRLALRLTADDCVRIGPLAADRGLAGNGVRWLTAESATDGWAFESRGYVAVPECPPSGGRAARPADLKVDAFMGTVRQNRSPCALVARWTAAS